MTNTDIVSQLRSKEEADAMTLWERCQEAADEIERLRALTTPQPIETVPKDGTIVDLFHKDGFPIRDEWWVAEDECFSCMFGLDDFTHWVLSPWIFQSAPKGNRP